MLSSKCFPPWIENKIYTILIITTLSLIHSFVFLKFKFIHDHALTFRKTIVNRGGGKRISHRRWTAMPPVDWDKSCLCKFMVCKHNDKVFIYSTCSSDQKYVVVCYGRHWRCAFSHQCPQRLISRAFDGKKLNGYSKVCYGKMPKRRKVLYRFPISKVTLYAGVWYGVKT